MLLLASLANACFCRLFDGNLTSMCIVFVATLVGFFIRQELTRRKLNHLAVFVICAFVSTMVGVTDYLYFHGGTEDITLGTSMLYLVPGVPLINGVMDIVDGHALDGIARLTNACLLIICIAVGLSATVITFDIDPTTFTKVVRPDVVQAAIADGLFAAVAGVGFAIISNPPRKALLICALLACVGHGIRYFLMHNSTMPLDQVTASTVGRLRHRAAGRAVLNAHTLPRGVLRLPVAAAHGARNVRLQGRARPYKHSATARRIHDGIRLALLPQLVAHSAGDVRHGSRLHHPNLYFPPPVVLSNERRTGEKLKFKN